MPEPRSEFREGDIVAVKAGPYKDARGEISSGCSQSSGRRHVAIDGMTVCHPVENLELVETKPTTPVRLVGITGRKRAGKDTVAARLVEKYGFKRMAFADNLRKVALAIDPIIAWKNAGEEVRLSAVVEIGGWEWAKALPEVRRLLQKIGTEGIRSLDPDFWIRQVMSQAEISSAPVVITDVRFPNEADAIKVAGGVILRVNRPGLSQDDQHSSESAMDGYLHDWSLNNSGTVEELFVKVDELVANGFKPA